jgi:hypothetical protein
MIVITFLTSLLIFLCLALSISLKLAGSLLLLSYGGYLFWYQGLLQGKQVITALQPMGDHRWLVSQSEQKVEATLLGDSTVTNWVAILRFRLLNRRRAVSCVVFKDALKPEQYRQLLVILRLG